MKVMKGKLVLSNKRDNSIRALAVAILMQAVKDVNDKNIDTRLEALEYLQAGEGAELALAFGIDRQDGPSIAGWALAGAPRFTIKRS